jgi:multicomponent Na+:H+ antiporter subunit F
MLMTDTGLMQVAHGGFYALIVSLAVVFVRLIRGPTLPDRIVALDMIGFLLIGLAALHALRSEQPAFLDVALIVALVAFLATAAFARFIERTSVAGEGGP